jgi:hypothetical protein
VFGGVEQHLLDRTLRQRSKARIGLDVVWDGDRGLMQRKAAGADATSRRRRSRRHPRQ